MKIKNKIIYLITLIQACPELFHDGIDEEIIYVLEQILKEVE